jgi:hypothetical protein
LWPSTRSCFGERDSDGQPKWLTEDSSYEAISVLVRERKSRIGLCQNRVTYPLKPPVHTVTYGHTPTHINVAEIVESELRWWDSVCVSTRERIRFPSVLLQPLGHLSVSLESVVYGPVVEPVHPNCVRNCVRPPNVPRTLTGTADAGQPARDDHGSGRRTSQV